MRETYRDQVAIVTGASSGIGRELARQLALAGCKVGIVARRRESLQTLAAEIGRAGGTAVVAHADVADRHQVRDAIEGIRARLGSIDLLIANAGLAEAPSGQVLNVEAIEELFRVNYFGVVYAIESVLPDMLQRGRGHLAAVSSLAAYRGLPTSSAYCASKAAVNVFLEGLRAQLRAHRIAVTTICPGFVRTPMTEANGHWMPWMLEPDVAANRILRALRRRRKVYAFPWQMALLMRLSRWLPDCILAHFLNRWRSP